VAVGGAAAEGAGGGLGGGGGGALPPPIASPRPQIPAAAAAPRAPPLAAEGYLDPHVRPPDEAAVAEAARRRLLALPAPAALVALVGRQGYCRALAELHGVLQSRVLLLQIGYALLGGLMGALMPELRHQIRQVESGAQL
jgi:hypothetical protein